MAVFRGHKHFYRYSHAAGQIFWDGPLPYWKGSGEVAGTLSDGRRLLTFSKSKRHGKFNIFAHRLRWFMDKKEMPPGLIKHTDGDMDNNSLSNLEDVKKGNEDKNKPLIFEGVLPDIPVVGLWGFLSGDILGKDDALKHAIRDARRLEEEIILLRSLLEL